MNRITIEKKKVSPLEECSCLQFVFQKKKKNSRTDTTLTQDKIEKVKWKSVVHEINNDASN